MRTGEPPLHPDSCCRRRCRQVSAPALTVAASPPGLPHAPIGARNRNGGAWGPACGLRSCPWPSWPCPGLLVPGTSRDLQGPPGTRALAQAWACVWPPEGWLGAQTYRKPRVALRAGGSRYAGAEEAATPRLSPLSFLPGIASVTLLPLWMETLIWDGSQTARRSVPAWGRSRADPTSCSGQGGAAGAPGAQAWQASHCLRVRPPQRLHRAMAGQCPSWGGQRAVLGERGLRGALSTGAGQVTHLHFGPQLEQVNRELP